MNETLFARFLARRRWWEAGFALAVVVLVNAVSATTQIMDGIRYGVAADWRPWVKEFTSGLVILALIPGIFWFHERFPIAWRTIGRTWGLHVLAFLVFALVHFVGMMALREAVFPLFGGEYYLPRSFGFQFLYEVRKDLLTYLFIVGVLYFYLFVLSRLQGEASFPGEDDERKPRERFLVKMLQREFLVDIDDIEWIQGARNYALLNVGKRSFPIRQSMASLEEELSGRGFLRVHRSAIVNLKTVCGLEKQEQKQMVVLRDGTKVPVSSTHLPELQQALAGP